MNINKTINKIFEDLMESQHSISDNKGYGYHGTVKPEIHNSKRKNSPLQGDEERARNHHYKTMHGTVRSLTGEHPKVVKHYLDSKHGRHLADVHNDNTEKRLAVGHVHKYIKKDFANFKKHYKPDMFEELQDFGVDEELEESTLHSSSLGDKETLTGKKVGKTKSGGEIHAGKIKFHRGGGTGHAVWVVKDGHVTHSHVTDNEEVHKKAVAHAKTADNVGTGPKQPHTEFTQHGASKKLISEELEEAVFVPRNYDKHAEHPSKSNNTFIKGVHGAEKEHINYIKSAAKSNGGKEIGDDQAKKVAHSSEYHSHVYTHRHDFSRGGSNGLDNGIKRLAGTHPHVQKEEAAEQIDELFTDSGSGFKSGDRVIVKNPSSPMHNQRGTYAGKERGRHVVKHGDGARSFHSDGVLLKETRAELVKGLVKESTKSADKKPQTVRTASGKLITKLVTRKHDVVDAGGKDDGNETENH